MLPRRGERYACPQCRLELLVTYESQWPTQQSGALRCVCGELLVLLQSGSESVQGSRYGTNKIVRRQNAGRMP